MATLIRVGGGISKPNTVVTLSSSQTWTVPAGVTKLWVWMCGGGSMGSPYMSNSGSGSSSWYGGFSSMPRQYLIDVTPGQTFAVVIGAGGGLNGGDTSFGSYTAGGAKFVERIDNDTGRDLYGNASGGHHHGFNDVVLYAGEAGNAGTLDAMGHSADRGYCWLTEEIYCGGGATAVLDASKGTSSSGSWTVGPTTAPVGGGPALPQIYIHEDSTPTYTMTVTGNITPANKWGAGGISVYVEAYFTGDMANTALHQAYQGVVIVGY